MKKLLTIQLFFFSLLIFGQAKEKNGYGPDMQHCVELDKALVEKNLSSLNQILHENLSLGHSNGWIESKESLLQNLPTSKVQYFQFIYHSSPILNFQNEEFKSIRRDLTAKGKLEEIEFQVDLKILEIWVKENDKWLLLSRQSVEVEFEK